jgi:hypothetical protein
MDHRLRWLADGSLGRIEPRSRVQIVSRVLELPLAGKQTTVKVATITGARRVVWDAATIIVEVKFRGDRIEKVEKRPNDIDTKRDTLRAYERIGLRIADYGSRIHKPLMPRVLSSFVIRNPSSGID